MATSLAYSIKKGADMSCEKCLDPDGVPCFPVYGLAPHVHTPRGTVFTGEIPHGFTPDPDSPGEGVHWCPNCGEGKPLEPMVNSKTDGDHHEKSTYLH